MAHKPEMVDWKELSNGEISVLIRCCGDPASDSWHTYAPTIPPEEVDVSIESKKTEAAELHEKRAALKAHFAKKIAKP